MADLTITAANVVPGADAKLELGFSGGTIVAGKAVYLDGADNKWKLADNNAATAVERKARGIALTGSSANQPVVVQLPGGDITIGAALTQGVAYYLSATAGGICPVADLSAGMYPQIIGVAKSATVLQLDFTSPGVAL